MDLLEVPEEPEFVVGGTYLRKELHDQFGGQRQYGISTPSDTGFVLVFTDTETEEHGYSDRFREDGIFIYSGEGRVGDMTMDRGNARIRDHQQNDYELFVFEKVGEQNGADVFTYIGEYEYLDHFWEQVEDDNGNMRDAVRFKLTPTGGVEASITREEAKELPIEELFERAKETSPGPNQQNETERSSSSNRTRYPRSDVVRDFALRSAQGECQGCGNDAPFLDENGEPFLEVHHLYRRSDGGPDDPENVIAVCPNCHRRAHHGKDNEDFNNGLINRAENRNARFSNQDDEKSNDGDNPE